MPQSGKGREWLDWSIWVCVAPLCVQVRPGFSVRHCLSPLYMFTTASSVTRSFVSQGVLFCSQVINVFTVITTFSLYWDS